MINSSNSESHSAATQFLTLEQKIVGAQREKEKQMPVFPLEDLFKNNRFGWDLLFYDIDKEYTQINEGKPTGISYYAQGILKGTHQF
jgi:hypothetical protein